jgi:hypothetical protein
MWTPDRALNVWMYRRPTDKRNYAEYLVMCSCEVMLGASRLVLEAGTTWRGIDYCA